MGLDEAVILNEAANLLILQIIVFNLYKSAFLVQLRIAVVQGQLFTNI